MGPRLINEHGSNATNINQSDFIPPINEVNTPMENYVLTLMKQEYVGLERYVIVFLTLASITAFYPLVYALVYKHKNRGFDVILTIAIALS
jgi:hypothetical protein